MKLQHFLKNFENCFKTVLNFYKTFSKIYLNFFQFCLTFALLCDKFIAIIMNYLFSAAPIAPRHAASRHADRHAHCTALRIVCISYRNAPLSTAKARTRCVYCLKSDKSFVKLQGND